MSNAFVLFYILMGEVYHPPPSGWFMKKLGLFLEKTLFYYLSAEIAIY